MFKDVIGQSRPISILQNAFSKNRMAHAYLFSGASGVGKVFTALQFAKVINCLNRPNSKYDSCDECESCKKIDTANHIDIGLVKLLKNKTEISIEQVRQLQSQVNLRPYEAKYKVFIIQDAQLANDEAQSALLKTLEEPPPKSVIILTTSDPDALLTTIISRCQLVKFSPLKTEDSKKVLMKRFNIDENSAHYLSYIAQTGLVDVSGFIKQDAIKAKNSIIAEFSDFIKSPSKELSFLKESDENILWSLSVLLWWYRDMLIFKETGINTGSIANQDRRDDLAAIAKEYDSLGLARSISFILNTARLLSQTNTSAKLALTVMATDILNEVKNV